MRAPDGVLGLFVNFGQASHCPRMGREFHLARSLPLAVSSFPLRVLSSASLASHSGILCCSRRVFGLRISICGVD